MSFIVTKILAFIFIKSLGSQLAAMRSNNLHEANSKTSTCDLHWSFEVITMNALFKLEGHRLGIFFIAYQQNSVLSNTSGTEVH